MLGELAKFLQSLRKYPPIPRAREGGRLSDELERKAGAAVTEIDASSEKWALPVTVATGILGSRKTTA
jgi:hypothetical protein